MKLIPLLILLSTQAFAHNWFSYPLLGKWYQRDPRFGRTLRIIGSHFLFDDCGPLELIGYQYQDYYFANNDLNQRSFRMYVRAYDTQNCLPEGDHYCEVKVNQWGLEADMRYLMVQCDNYQFMRFYDREMR